MDTKRKKALFAIHCVNFCLILIGILLRLKHFLENRSLWLDEAYLAISVTSRSFAEILQFQPIFFDQPSSPTLFVILVKICTIIFGNNEIALRLIPLLSSIASIFLFYIYLKKNVSAKFIPLCLGLFVFMDALVYYGSELKPYSTDVFCTLALFIFIDFFIKNVSNSNYIRFFGWFGALCMWLSYPSIYILAGFTVFLGFQYAKHKQGELFLKHTFMYLLWTLSFILLYKTSLSQMISNQYIIGGWSSAFMPLNDGFSTKLHWIIKSFIDVFHYPLGLINPAGMMFLFLFGVLQGFKDDANRSAILLLPILITLGASIANKYPFEGRMILFLVPSFIIFLSSAIAFAYVKNKKTTLIIGTLLCVIIFYLPAKTAFKQLRQPRSSVENRLAVELIANKIKPNDLLFLNSSAQYPWWYYYSRLGVSPRMKKEFSKEYKQTFNVDKNVAKIYDQIENLDGIAYGGLRFEKHAYNNQGRFRTSLFEDDPNQIELLHLNMHGDLFKNKNAWIFLSHLPSENQDFILKCFDQIGKRKEEHHFKNATAVYYKFSKE